MTQETQVSIYIWAYIFNNSLSLRVVRTRRRMTLLFKWRCPSNYVVLPKLVSR